ncbi:MAG TPA: hypothetical protein V6C57_21355, partial [Coleofasciculaceae cyanobacterium]
NFVRGDYFALTFLRDPVAQLISHINWVIHIYDIGLDFFYTHPKEIQDMCLELRNVNLYDPDVFIGSLMKFDCLFKNYQSKYFIEDWENLRSVDVLENIAKLDMVGITEFYERSLQKFAALNQLNVDIEVDFINQNPGYRLEKDIYENPLINEFIQDYNQVDIEVYAHVLHQFKLSNTDYSKDRDDKVQVCLQQSHRTYSIVETIKVDPDEVVEKLLGFAIDSPLSSMTIEGDTLLIAGWAIGQSAKAVALRVIFNQQTLAEVPINHYRPDVAEVYAMPGAIESGFLTTIAIAELQPHAEIQLQVLLEDQEKVKVGVIRSAEFRQ